MKLLALLGAGALATGAMVAAAPASAQYRGHGYHHAYGRGYRHLDGGYRYGYRHRYYGGYRHHGWHPYRDRYRRGYRY